MGLIKAVVALTIAVVLSNMLKQFGENNKDKAYVIIIIYIIYIIYIIKFNYIHY